MHEPAQMKPLKVTYPEYQANGSCNCQNKDLVTSCNSIRLVHKQAKPIITTPVSELLNHDDRIDIEQLNHLVSTPHVSAFPAQVQSISLARSKQLRARLHAVLIPNVDSGNEES